MRILNKVFFLLVATIASSFIYLTDVYTSFSEYKPYIASIILFISLFAYFCGNNWKVYFFIGKSKMLLIYWGLLICTLISTLVIKNYFNYSVYIIQIMISSIFLSNIKFFKEISKLFFIAQIFGLIPLVKFLHSLNTLGLIFSYGGVIAVFLLRNSRFKEKVVLRYIVSIVFFALISFTGSRTSLMSYFCVLLLDVLWRTNNLNKRKLIVMLSALVVFVFQIPRILHFFQEYFIGKWGNSDLTSGRVDIWRFLIIDNDFIRLWGNGDTFVGQFFKVTDSHNIFVQYVIQFGILASLLFILLLFLEIYQIFHMGKLKSLLGGFVTWYLITGMFENIIFIHERINSFCLPFMFVAIYFTYLERGKDFESEKKYFIDSTF